MSRWIQTRIPNGKWTSPISWPTPTNKRRNDILRKHGVIPEKEPDITPQIEEALELGRKLAHENRLEGKDLDELDELEDDEDEEFLEKYRFVDRKHIDLVNISANCSL
jgi:hypothetical protein